MKDDESTATKSSAEETPAERVGHKE